MCRSQQKKYPLPIIDEILDEFFWSMLVYLAGPLLRVPSDTIRMKAREEFRTTF